MNSADLNLNLNAVLPALAMVGSAILVMLVDIFNRGGRTTTRALLPWLALAGVVVTGGICYWLLGQPMSHLPEHGHRRPLCAWPRFRGAGRRRAGHPGQRQVHPRRSTDRWASIMRLLLLVAAGMMMMGAALDLMVVFLALEIFSLGLYILSGLNRNDPLSSEAAMKYFLLGAFASAFFVYGAALVYGATGALNSTRSRRSLATGQGEFESALSGDCAADGRLWLQGEPGALPHVDARRLPGCADAGDGLHERGTKAAAFAAFYRLFLMALPTEQAVWGLALAILAVLTMTLGNLAALRQTSLKRLLAYSSIAHAGYILVGLATGTLAGADARALLLDHLRLHEHRRLCRGDDAGEAGRDGCRRRSAARAGQAPAGHRLLVMAVFMFSLAGVPPFAGFFAKFFVFSAAVQGGWSWLAAIAMLNSAIGAYYYLRITVSMYFGEPDAETATSCGAAGQRRWACTWRWPLRSCWGFSRRCGRICCRAE